MVSLAAEHVSKYLFLKRPREREPIFLAGLVLFAGPYYARANRRDWAGSALTNR